VGGTTRKTFLILFMLAAAPAVGESVRTSTPPYTPPSNAYWQITTYGSGGKALGCVLEGQDQYGNGDDCSIYNTDAVDFAGASVINFEFDISLVTDSDNRFVLDYYRLLRRRYVRLGTPDLRLRERRLGRLVVMRFGLLPVPLGLRRFGY
jgi:hypothetical protein